MKYRPTSMKVDVPITFELSNAGHQARQFEDAGIAGIFTTETNHDPFLPLASAALSTKRVELITSIAVAFARTPMSIAYIAHDLNVASGGRFVLGLGSQIQPHITKRFSMQWSKPAARMREFIQALRAIWQAWFTHEPLAFRGEFYRHTLMTPFFTPENVEIHPPRVFLAAVGPLMTQVAGEVADGLIVHPFTTLEYLREVTLPALDRGVAVSGRSRDQIEISIQPLVATGKNARELEIEKRAVKQQLAFYGSTPAYKSVLDSVGLGSLQEQLNVMSKQGRWQEMSELFKDEHVEHFAIVAEPQNIPSQLRMKFGEIVDRTSIYSKNLTVSDYQNILQELRR